MPSRRKTVVCWSFISLGFIFLIGEVGLLAAQLPSARSNTSKKEKPYLAGYSGITPLLLIAESHEAFTAIEQKYIAGDRENMMREWPFFNFDEKVLFLSLLALKESRKAI